MITLLSAEARRLLSTRLWVWALAAAVFTGVLVSVMALAGPENFDPPMPALSTAQGTRLVLGMAGLLAFVPALLGTTAVTAEYRHQTITFTYLFVPRRGTVLAAKLGIYGVAGLAYGLVVAVLAGAGLAVAAAVHGITLGLPTGELVGLLLRIAVMMAVYTLLGVAFGALLRNQVTALAVLGGYFYMGETLLLLIPGVNTMYPFLPGGASSALTGFTFLADAVAQTGISAPHLLSAPLGALVLLGYAVVAAVLAFATSLRRDVA
ncbi:ABC transporter permease subunit [Kibdelosporangium persicum]|uniref:ABC-type transport system involved in multi-copper enzyme maturation permease subunit n=1 Tax=Kibdelosporangium persicum TaxID=2698649 RepID=A0ABX2F5U2_9PSEU|nr:ABC transporter permease subunit [Kibdelosporangium persicum]NRN66731.1 ABC-type transport system involved in multi-copper enzyme maturation permease subunit [Kibdelosporangium persicum]